MRWIGTALLVLVVAGFVWSLVGDLFAYVASVGPDSVDEVKEWKCPYSEDVFDKK